MARDGFLQRLLDRPRRYAPLSGWRGAAARMMFLYLVGGVATAFIVGLAFIFVMDPYHGDPSRPAPILKRARYNGYGLPWLLNVVVAQGYDTILVGGSTAEAIDPADMQRELAGTRRAFSYFNYYSMPRDRALIQDRVASARGLRRVLLTYDIAYVPRLDAPQDRFPFELYDDNPFNDFRDEDLGALRLSLEILLGREYYLPNWSVERTNAEFKALYRSNLAPDRIAKIKTLIAANRARIDAPTPFTCADLPATHLVRRFATTLAARHVPLDVIIMPSPFVMYYIYSGDNRHEEYFRGQPVLASLLKSRQCLLEDVDGLANVRVFAFDSGPINEDAGNFRDGAHLKDTAFGPRLLSAIEHDQNRLTLANFPAYQDELRRKVRNYVYHNSAADHAR